MIKGAEDQNSKSQIVDEQLRKQEHADDLSLIHSILEPLKAERPIEAVALIKTTPRQVLNILFEFKSKKTTLICEAALMKSVEVVKALLEKKVDVNVNLSSDENDEETVIKRLLWSDDFNEEAVPILKLLIKQGANLFILNNQGYKASVLECIYQEFLKKSNTEGRLVAINKYKILMNLMGDSVCHHLLHLSRPEGCTPVSRLRKDDDREGDNELFKELYDSALHLMLSHLENQRHISNETFFRLLLSSDFDDKIVSFVKRKLIKNGQEVILPQEKRRNATLVQTNYKKSEAYLDPKFTLFKYKNERNAFEIGLRNPVLSYDAISDAHEVAILENEIQGVCDGNLRTDPGKLGSECSISGFFELQDCHRNGWFNLKRYGEYFELFTIQLPVAKKLVFLSLIKEYNQDMEKLRLRTEKLKRIIKLASDISRMHYFKDANKRTSFVILNCELIKHGFLPANIENRLILRSTSQDEIFSEVLNGMEKSLNELAALTQNSANGNNAKMGLFYAKQKRRLSPPSLSPQLLAPSYKQLQKRFSAASGQEVDPSAFSHIAVGQGAKRRKL